MDIIPARRDLGDSRNFVVTRRLTRKDWFIVGLKSLATGGVDAINIDILCKQAGKTRGSFYHHFKALDDFIKAMLEYWEQVSSTSLIEITRETTGTRKRLNHLAILASNLDIPTETAIRRLAAHNEIAKICCARVDKIRIEYLTDAYAASSRYSTREAVILATVEYATWIGLQHINSDMMPGEITGLYEGFLAIRGR